MMGKFFGQGGMAQISASVEGSARNRAPVHVNL